MRLTQYLNEEDVIKRGLSVDEPEVGEDYTEEEVTDHLLPVLAALDHLRKKGIESDADEAIFRDLKDKKDKWENVDKETKPAGPDKTEEPAEEEPAEEEPEEEKKEEPDKEEDEEDKEEK